MGIPHTQYCKFTVKGDVCTVCMHICFCLRSKVLIPINLTSESCVQQSFADMSPHTHTRKDRVGE